jgi:hypothetical protein
MDEEVDRTMRRFSAYMGMQPPGLLDRVWYWRCGMDQPRSIGTTRKIKYLKWARLVPRCFKIFHRRFATRHGLFWLPCVLCTWPYGGHQAAGSVPDPTQQPEDPELGPWFYVGICPRCTRSRKDVR